MKTKNVLVIGFLFSILLFAGCADYQERQRLTDEKERADKLFQEADKLGIQSKEMKFWLDIYANELKKNFSKWTLEVFADSLEIYRSKKELGVQKRIKADSLILERIPHWEAVQSEFSKEKQDSVNAQHKMFQEEIIFLRKWKIMDDKTYYWGKSLIDSLKKTHP